MLHYLTPVHPQNLVKGGKGGGKKKKPCERAGMELSGRSLPSVHKALDWIPGTRESQGHCEKYFFQMKLFGVACFYYLFHI
jgi:hypothetical protein